MSKRTLPQDIMLAHQYLYHVKGDPIISDYAFDEFCKKHKLDGSGGSDSESSYDERIVRLSRKVRAELSKEVK